MAKLWVRLTETFGYKFSSQFGDTPSDTWSLQLADVLPEQMACGLRRATESDPVWPPGAAAFRAFCLGKMEKTAEDARRKTFDECQGRKVARERWLADTSAHDASKKARDSIMAGLKDKLAS